MPTSNPFDFESISHAAGLNSTVYEYMENGGDVYDDIDGMSLDEMEDYFGDQDPILFL